jgi:hypothetical protein
LTESADRDEYADHFNPREYLRQYYSLPQLAADDADLFRTLCGWLKQTGRVYPTALDVGCGPTIHNSFALAPYADRIDLADYLPANLVEVEKWLRTDPDAHDWKPLFRGVLEHEGTPLDRLEERTQQYRSKVTQLRHCDLRRASPLGEPAQYDLVTSFFCAECVASDRDEWEMIVGRILDMVNTRTDGGWYSSPTCGIAADTASSAGSSILSPWTKATSPICSPVTGSVASEPLPFPHPTGSTTGSTPSDWPSQREAGSGAIFFAAMRNCVRYRVLGRSFPSVPIVEDDFYRVLKRHGFAPASTRITAVPAPDWIDDGFDQIILVSAIREPPP